MAIFKHLKRAAAEYSYIDRRRVYRMLRDLGHPASEALRNCVFSLAEYKAYFRDSGMRLMLYREHRDPMDRMGECYFGRNHLRSPVETVVDVGAHAGICSWACYKLLRPRNIHLYEPNQDLVPELNVLAARMPDAKVHIRNVAVGATDGETAYRKVESSVLNSMLDFNEQDRDLVAAYGSSLVQTTTVPQVSLDSEFRNCDEIDYLKIDTQGYEMSVLRGARETLAKTRVVMIESNFVSIYAGGSTFCDVHRFLSDSGFLLVQLDAPSRANGVIVWTDALYIARRLLRIA